MELTVVALVRLESTAGAQGDDRVTKQSLQLCVGQSTQEVTQPREPQEVAEAGPQVALPQVVVPPLAQALPQALLQHLLVFPQGA